MRDSAHPEDLYDVVLLRPASELGPQGLLPGARLWLDGAATPLEVTGYHKLWSATRQTWTSVDDLQPGEHLRTLDGDATVARLERVPGIHRVYNFEVETEHCYFAGTERVLGHNSCVRAEFTHVDADGTSATFRGAADARVRAADGVPTVTLNEAAAAGVTVSGTPRTASAHAEPSAMTQAIQSGRTGGDGILVVDTSQNRATRGQLDSICGSCQGSVRSAGATMGLNSLTVLHQHENGTTGYHFDNEHLQRTRGVTNRHAWDAANRRYNERYGTE